MFAKNFDAASMDKETQLVKGSAIPDAAIRLYPITSPSVRRAAQVEMVETSH
jgi:hypothetical protein